MNYFLFLILSISFIDSSLASTSANMSNNESKAVVVLDNATTFDGNFLFDLLKLSVGENGGVQIKKIASANHELDIACTREIAHPSNTKCVLTYLRQDIPFSAEVIISKSEQFITANFYGDQFNQIKDTIPESDTDLFLSPDHRFTILKNVGASGQEIWFGWSAAPAN